MGGITVGIMPDFYEHLLQDIFRLVLILQDTQADPEKFRRGDTIKLLERGPVPQGDASKQFLKLCRI